MPQLTQFFATILDADIINGDTYFDCVFISMTEATARTKKDWISGKTLRRRDTWNAIHIVNNNITVKFVPNNEVFAAKIYKMERKS